MPSTCFSISVHNFAFRIKSSSNPLKERLKRDFYLYTSDDHTAHECVELDCHLEKAPSGFKSISFKGQAQVLMDHDNKNATIYCPDLERLHEVTYLYILSILGKKLDLQGVHRIHASAVSFDHQRAAILVGKSGVGKSHLAYLLGGETLSDDTPLLDAYGLRPLQIRRGFVSEKMIRQADKESLYQLDRHEYGLKKLLPLTVRASSEHYDLQTIFLLREAPEVAVVQANLWHKLHDFGRYMLIGEGTPLIFEFFWKPGLKDFLIKTKIFFLRLKLLVQLLFHRKTYVLYTNKTMTTIDVVKEHLEANR